MTVGFLNGYPITNNVGRDCPTENFSMKAQLTLLFDIIIIIESGRRRLYLGILCFETD